jgi:hypothetical protein
MKESQLGIIGHLIREMARWVRITDYHYQCHCLGGLPDKACICKMRR